jgi:hypothetical protein
MTELPVVVLRSDFEGMCWTTATLWFQIMTMPEIKVVDIQTRNSIALVAD